MVMLLAGVCSGKAVGFDDDDEVDMQLGGDGDICVCC